MAKQPAAKVAQIDTKQDGSKRPKLSQAEFPNVTLEHALRIAQAIWDNFAGKGAPPHSVAMAIGLTPTSGNWRNLCGSSIAYGLTEGGYNATQIVLTDLGRRIVAPTEDGGEIQAKIKALLQPRIMGEFFNKYDKAKFPKPNIAENVLVSLGVPKERAAQSVTILAANGSYTGVIHQLKTGPFVAMDNVAGSTASAPIDGAATNEPEDNSESVEAFVQSTAKLQAPTVASPAKKQLFVAHGKNHKPLDDLKKILDQFKIPYKVALDEAHAGRPISGKVAELMHECSAGIFIFTKDELFLRENKAGGQDEVWRPSENVVYELGAANILWDKKIIIVREDGVNFPSDFSDLGYITFKDGEIANKALDILKELIALGLVQVTAA